MTNGVAKVGPYEILGEIHRGPRAFIHVASRPDSEREVVVKRFTDGTGSRGDWPTAEIAAAARLSHRNIIRILDVGRENGSGYIAMERLRGRTLGQVLADATTAVESETRVDWMAQVCVGLHHAHEQQLVHGNVTPDNIFITDDGVAKILNFGTTSTVDRTMVSDNSLAGSFEYMSPEQIIGRETIDGRSDVFAAAVILYELVAGRRPFRGASTTATIARILRDDPTPVEGLDRLNALLRRALEKEPAKRFGSAQEFAYSLWMLNVPDLRADDESQAVPIIDRSGAESDTAPQPAIVVPPAPSTTSASASGFLASKESRIYAAAIAAAVVILGAATMMSC